MSKIDYLNYDDVREDRRQQKKFKKKKGLKEAKNKRRKKNMLKKMIRYIFIYTIGLLFIGCDNPMSVESCDYCYLEIDAPDLPMDENGVYHLDYRNGDLQSFTQLRAYVGYEMEYLGWTTNVTFEGCTWDYCEDIPVVNGASYTNEEGYGYTMMGVSTENIGMIATIWVGYYDNYGTQWLDSIRIKIDE